MFEGGAHRTEIFIRRNEDDVQQSAIPPLRGHDPVALLERPALSVLDRRTANQVDRLPRHAVNPDTFVVAYLPEF